MDETTGRHTVVSMTVDAKRHAAISSERITKPSGYPLGLIGAWLAFGISLIALDGCKGNAQPSGPPPPEVSVIDVRPSHVTVYDEYVAQTQAPDTIEIRSQVTGLLERQVFTDGARVKKGDLLYIIDQRPFEAQLAVDRAEGGEPAGLRHRRGAGARKHRGGGSAEGAGAQHRAEPRILHAA